MCTSTKLYRKVREFRVLGTTHYSDHRPLSLTLDTIQPINIELHQIMADELMSAPAPFKWIRSDDPTKDTSTLFKEAQRSQTIENNIVDLVNRSTWSAEDAIKLNQEVVLVATFTKAVATVATKKSGKRPNKKKWYDNDCRMGKRVVNKAERNVVRNPHDQNTRDELSYKTKSYRTIKRRKKTASSTLPELESAIKNLKNNKSVSGDLISNEMLKNLSGKSEQLLLKLFNDCLQQGVYPWNSSITTPLHKKGDRQNPVNYRAITVGSCLGKLFSSLLLARLLDFRETMCPDYPNQLGFRSGAQCSDHILTLSTIIEKYVRLGKRRLFACFVDYRKAFDTVCRDALLFKLKQIGIAGIIFQCLNYMYCHSSTRIKLIKKLSAAIDVTVGTEQGHPMSPELFKLFIHDLSTKLEEIEELNLPLLNGFKVSHLLWADDLVLLALDATSLQKLLDCLNDYADRWELSVNINKTNIMVFNTSSRILKCAYGFKLGDLEITPVRTYCYLGILFSLNGSFKHAIDTLRKKALRSFFSLKRTLDTRALTTKTMLREMDYRRPQKNQQQLLLRRHWTTSVDINRNTPVYQLFRQGIPSH